MTPVGQIDHEWLRQHPDWRHEPRLCRIRLRSGRWTCTLMPGHQGRHIAHSEDNGCVLDWDEPPLPDYLQVSEGL